MRYEKSWIDGVGFWLGWPRVPGPFDWIAGGWG